MVQVETFWKIFSGGAEFPMPGYWNLIQLQFIFRLSQLGSDFFEIKLHVKYRFVCSWAQHQFLIIV